MEATFATGQLCESLSRKFQIKARLLFMTFSPSHNWNFAADPWQAHRNATKMVKQWSAVVMVVGMRGRLGLIGYTSNSHEREVMDN